MIVAVVAELDAILATFPAGVGRIRDGITVIGFCKLILAVIALGVPLHHQVAADLFRRRLEGKGQGPVGRIVAVNIRSVQHHPQAVVGKAGAVVQCQLAGVHLCVLRLAEGELNGTHLAAPVGHPGRRGGLGAVSGGAVRPAGNIQGIHIAAAVVDLNVGNAARAACQAGDGIAPAARSCGGLGSIAPSTEVICVRVKSTIVHIGIPQHQNIALCIKCRRSAIGGCVIDTAHFQRPVQAQAALIVGKLPGIPNVRGGVVVELRSIVLAALHVVVIFAALGVGDEEILAGVLVPAIALDDQVTAIGAGGLQVEDRAASETIPTGHKVILRVQHNAHAVVGQAVVGVGAVIQNVVPWIKGDDDLQLFGGIRQHAVSGGDGRLEGIGAALGAAALAHLFAAVIGPAALVKINGDDVAVLVLGRDLGGKDVIDIVPGKFSAVAGICLYLSRSVAARRSCAVMGQGHGTIL